MTIEPELLMAYADGELDPLAVRRVERAIAADPALAAEVERHRALRRRVAGDFAPIAEEAVPDRLAALVRGNVVPIRPALRPAVLAGWPAMAAMAACLVLGLSVGLTIDRGPVSADADGLYASGVLASALEEQRSGGDGPIRIAVSFRNQSNDYCRVFSSRVTDGIACKDRRGWSLRRTMPGSRADAHEGYAQAASAEPELMAAAQDMMAGQPLDAAGEQAARQANWRR